MPFLAGQPLTVDQLDLIQPRYRIASQSSTVSLSLSGVSIPGCLITVTTLTDNADWRATGFVDFDIGTATTTGVSGRLVVDGVEEAKVIRWAGELVSDLGTPGNQWGGTFALAGNHTVFLRGYGPSTIVAFAHSTISLEYIENY